ncbi:MAG: ABC transporter permease subunit [Candidatus Polarisedimenticolia bacterium]|nr:ABC transporter permease [bacterium]
MSAIEGNAPAIPAPAQAIGAIARRELREHFTSLRFVVIGILVLVMTPLAVYVGARDYASRRDDWARHVADRQKLAEGPAGIVKGMDLPYTQGNDLEVLRVVRPPSRWSVLVRGVDASLPAYWDFGPSGVEPGSPATQTLRLTDAYGMLDMEFIVRVALGLLAILLAFDAVCGEKELGTLRAVLAQPVSRVAFLTAKLIGGAITLVVPWAAALLLGVATAGLMNVDLLRGADLARLAALFCVGALYLVVLFAFGLLVSSLAANQKSALVVALVAWVLVTLALPPTASMCARAVVPVPSQEAIAARRQFISQDLEREAELRRGDVFRDVTGATRVSLELFERFDKELRRGLAAAQSESWAKRRRVLGDLDAEWKRRVSAQDQAAIVMASASPGALFARAAANIVGTGDDETRGWNAAVQWHAGQLETAIFQSPPSFYLRTANGQAYFEQRPGVPVADLPSFSEPRDGVAEAVSSSLAALLLLTGMAALFVSAGYRAFARYDVR